MKDLKILKLESRAMMPIKEHGASFGHTIHNLHYTRVESGVKESLHTGLAIEPRTDRAFFIFGEVPTLFNNMIEIGQKFGGSGEDIKIDVINTGTDVAEIKPYSGLARMIVLKVCGGAPRIVDQLDNTLRGEGAYGSTGLN